MRKSKCCAAIASACVGLLAAGSVSAAPTGALTLTDGSGVATTSTINGSRNFTAEIFFTSNAPTTDLNFFFNNITQNGTGTALQNAFKVVSRTTSTAYPDANPTDTDTTNVVGKFLNLASPPSLDFSTANVQTTSNPAGTNYLVTTYVVNAAAGVPNGTYTLSLTGTPPDDGFFDNTGNASNSGNPYPYTTLGTLTVVVPEPSGILLLGAGMLALGVRRRRRSEA